MPDPVAAPASSRPVAEEPAHRFLPDRFLTGIRPDIAFYALLLSACGLFYVHWEMWEDQSAQVYMTWGLFHGMRPYVDLIDPNWPGILLPHMLAYMLSGVGAWGVRAVDLLFLFALLCTTSWMLAAWNVPRSLRLLAGSAYLLNYFGTGWWWTAQRESFCWPIFVISAIPFVPQLRPGSETPPRTFSRRAWFGFGMLAGLSLWIKPVAWLALFLLLALALLLCDAQQRRSVIGRSCIFAAGIALTSGIFISILAFAGMLAGFIKWGILYDLGPYSQVKWPWSQRLWMTFQFVVTPEYMPLPIVLAVGGAVMVFALRLSSQRWRWYRRPLIVALALLLAGLMTALLQGKTQSLYHFIPMNWAIAFFAATVWSLIPWRPAFANAATLLTVGTVMAIFLHGPASAGPTAGEPAADELRPSLSPEDRIVEWGYAPSLLARLQRKTPMATFIGTSLLITSPPDSWAYREQFDRLDAALRNPSVRYFILDRTRSFVMLHNIEYPRDYLMQSPAVMATLAREYRALPDEKLKGFDVFQHLPSSQQISK